MQEWWWCVPKHGIMEFCVLLLNSRQKSSSKRNDGFDSTLWPPLARSRALVATSQQTTLFPHHASTRKCFWRSRKTAHDKDKGLSEVGRFGLLFRLLSSMMVGCFFAVVLVFPVSVSWLSLVPFPRSHHHQKQTGERSRILQEGAAGQPNQASSHEGWGARSVWH